MWSHYKRSNTNEIIVLRPAAAKLNPLLGRLHSTAAPSFDFALPTDLIVSPPWHEGPEKPHIARLARQRIPAEFINCHRQNILLFCGGWSTTPVQS